MASLKNRVKVLGVTVLTHLDQRTWRPWGLTPGMPGTPANCAAAGQAGQAAGCDGVVCAGTEARAVKAACGPDFLVVCPGSARPGPRCRAMIKTGHDPLIGYCGRGRLYCGGTPHPPGGGPAAAARKVVAEIEQGLRDRGP